MHVSLVRHKRVADSSPSAKAQKRKAAESGQSLIEFALFLPVLCLVSIGIIEIGRAAVFTIAVNNAATAGVEYGSQNEATAQDITGMINNATQDANLPSVSHLSMTATATYGCTCDNASGTSCTYPVPGQGSCPTIDCGGFEIIECVQVNTTATWDSLFNYPGLPSTYQANGKAVMRVRR